MVALVALARRLPALARALVAGASGHHLRAGIGVGLAPGVGTGPLSVCGTYAGAAPVDVAVCGAYPGGGSGCVGTVGAARCAQWLARRQPAKHALAAAVRQSVC